MVQQSSEQKNILCWDHGFFYHLECVVGLPMPKYHCIGLLRLTMEMLFSDLLLVSNSLHL
jgi:hypothetical protein